MKLKGLFWSTFSLLLWVCLAVVSVSFLLRERAQASIATLSAKDAVISNEQLNIGLSNIESWLKLKHKVNFFLEPSGLPHESNAYSSLLETAKKIMLQSSVANNISISSDCEGCSAAHQAFLKELSEKLFAAKKMSEKVTESLLATSRLEQQVLDNIKAHQLLAQDFAELLGSKSLYESKGKTELLYYRGGPFNGLPLLDNSATASTAAQEVEDLSEKIERLRKNSQEIIANDERNKSDIKNSEALRRELETALQTQELKIRQSIIEQLRMAI